MPIKLIRFMLIAGAIQSAQVSAQVTPHAGVPDNSCEQIRAEISAHAGIPATPNTDLLHKLSGRSECKFTSTEAYRAAYGDKLPPPREKRSSASRHDEEHD